MKEEEILNVLDHSNDGYYRLFASLGHPYSYLIDARLNVFRSDNDEWAIAIERLGFNPRASSIDLEIYYYGNCLRSLEYYNNRPTNNYEVYPIDYESFNSSIECESLKVNATFWLVRGQKVNLSQNKKDYESAGIELKEYEPGKISVEEAARLAILKHSELFRATDSELYKSIPFTLNKILVLDEWFHKDFYIQPKPSMTDEELRKNYEFNKNLNGLGRMIFEEYAEAYRRDEILNDEWNRESWENNRPSSYETWQLIAKVIANNDISLYKPTLKPNTHWSNWPESGSL